MMEKELEGREGYLVEPEPEVVAAVEGGNLVPCPTCGGLCREKLLGAMGAGLIKQYEPLVKGEVVAEGSARPIYGSASPLWEFFDSWYPEGAAPAVLVIRAARKENARTGGKERDANSS
jgi:hypothetical protein